MKILFFLTSFSLLLSAEYLSNKDCNECHKDIYNEYRSSYHSKSFFTDELHRKVANQVSTTKYECAACHMAAANNLEDLKSGFSNPDTNNVTHTDGVSCFYCHSIAYVKEAHVKNKIILSKQPQGYKPRLYASLEDPEDSDKHSAGKSPIYEKYACNGCHSHKRNSHDVLIFRAMKKGQSSEECIECHMPKINGGVEDMNKRGRMQHHSHRFLGIHDIDFRKKGLEIAISTQKDKLEIHLKNKMAHPLIIQPARMKYLKIDIIRDGKIIWTNFKNDPMEDKQAAFVTEFADENGKLVNIPAFAYGILYQNNINAKSTKDLVYTGMDIKKGDIVEVKEYLYLSKPSCSAVLDLQDKSITKPILIKKVKYIAKD